MNRRATDKTATRGKIITSARELVGRRGFAAVTTAEIARAAGLSHGAIFVHFPTREALIDALVEDFAARTGTRLQKLAGHGKGLKPLLAAHLAAIREDEPFYTAIVRERTLLPHAAQNTFIAFQSALSHLFEERLACTTHHRDHALYFNTWIALVHYYLGQRDLFAKKGESIVERHGKRLESHFLKITQTIK
jgi:AcrR family transcriptional regulator